jgi:hypothetical protein
MFRWAASASGGRRLSGVGATAGSRCRRSRGRTWHASQMRVISCRPPLWARIACALFCTGVSVTLVTANAQDYASGRAGAVVYAWRRTASRRFARGKLVVMLLTAPGLEAC